MKQTQTLSDIATVLREIELGKRWEYQATETLWVESKDKQTLPLTMAAIGYAIRIKPAEADQQFDPHPNRSEVEEGIAQGKKWQCRRKGRPELYTWSARYSKHQLPTWSPDYEYRLAPEPEHEYIPLGPEDVPPGSSIKHAEIEALVLRVCVSGVWIVGRTGTPYEVEFEELKDEWLINRSLPLTGKWDPTAWEPCRKLKPQTT